MNEMTPNEFEKATAEDRRTSLLHEIWFLLKHNKKWWLLPIIVLLMILSLLFFLSTTAIAPLIYTLF